MILTICAPIILAVARHYKLACFFKSWSCYPVIIMQCILIFFQGSVFFGTYYFVRYAVIIEQAIILSFLFPIFVYHLYKPAVIGSCSILIGSGLNKFVIAQNGGKMPAFPSLSYITGYISPQAFGVADNLHILGSEATKYKFLTDYIDLGYSILSPGDVFIHLFTFLMLYSTIKAASIRCGTLQENDTLKM